MAEQTTLEVKTDETLVKLKKIKQINKDIEEIERKVSVLKNNPLVICSFNIRFYLHHVAEKELIDELTLKVLASYEDQKNRLVKEAEALMK